MNQQVCSMATRRIILAWAIFLTTSLIGLSPQIAPASQPVASPYPVPTLPPPPAATGPTYIQPSQVIQPAPQAMPVFPPQSTVVPLPSQTPGSIFGPSVLPGSPPPATFAPPNAAPPVAPLVAPAPPTAPILVPVADEEFAWDQIADVVAHYFTIAREQRARLDGGIEGRIDTAPQDGATWLEPHRRDSVGEFNRWESTFQTIRRRAIVRVIPDPGGYLVEVIVEKELEDLPQPEKATAGAAAFPSETSLPSRRLEQVNRTRSSPRWIQIGRDPPLEQRMLADIHARLSGVVAGPGSVFAQ